MFFRLMLMFSIMVSCVENPEKPNNVKSTAQSAASEVENTLEP